MDINTEYSCVVSGLLDGVLELVFSRLVVSQVSSFSNKFKL